MLQTTVVHRHKLAPIQYIIDKQVPFAVHLICDQNF